MNDPDVILLIDPGADRPAQQPIVRKRPRPKRVDLEHRRRHARALRLGLMLQKCLTNTETNHAGGEHRTEDKSALLLKLDHRRLPIRLRRVSAGIRRALSWLRRL